MQTEGALLMEQRLHGDRVCVLSEFVFGPELKLVYTFSLPVHTIMYMILTVTLHVLFQIIADMQKKIRKLKKMLRQVMNTTSSAQYPVLYQIHLPSPCSPSLPPSSPSPTTTLFLLPTVCSFLSLSLVSSLPSLVDRNH